MGDTYTKSRNESPTLGALYFVLSKSRYILSMIEILHYLIGTVNYGNYGIFLLMGNAGFLSSTVGSFETYLVSMTLSFGLGLLGFRRPV